MPGLLDMFQPTDPLGERTGFGNALTSRSNSMIGMGLGLLQPYRSDLGQTPMTNALQGWQGGAATDLASARAQQQAQMERARLALAQQQANKEPEAVRLWKLSEGNPAMRAALFPKADAGWKLWTNPEDDQTYWINDKGEAHPFRLGQPPGGGGASQPGGGAGGTTTPVVPGTTLYWPGQQGATADQTQPTAPATPAGPPALKRQFEPEEKLRKEFQANTKAHAEVRQSYQRVLASRDDAAGDLALIFGFMKMLDPGSVVREGEFANAQNAAGIPDVVRNLYNRAISGERLNPNQREQFKSQAGAIYDKYEQEYNAFADQYRGIARQYRLEPSRVVTDLPRPQAPAATQVMPPSAITQPAPAVTQVGPTQRWIRGPNGQIQAVDRNGRVLPVQP